MFGYITPDKPELKIKDYEGFRAYYCGLCKAMGKNHGILSRFALNYDSVFLGLFLSSVHKEKVEFKKEVCFANPIKKKLVVRGSKSLEYAADINTMLIYHKFKDNWMDEKNYLSATALIVFKHTYNQAVKRNPKVNEIIIGSLLELGKLEKAKCDSFDQAAEPFAQMMKKLLSIGYYDEDEKTRRIIEWLGYNIGKWVYVIDAFDDLADDMKKQCYNPLLLKYDVVNIDTDSVMNQIREEVKESLTHTLWQSSNALELLKVNNKGIIDNILYEGMYKKMEFIIDKRGCKKDE